MSDERIVRAWKDEEFRQTLDETEREALPENPAGEAEIGDEELDEVVGGGGTIQQTIIGTVDTGCFGPCDPQLTITVVY